MRTYTTFELLTVPHFFHQHSELLKQRILKLLLQQEELPKNFDSIQNLKSRVKIVCSIQIIHTNNPWSIFLTIHIVSELILIHFSQILLRIRWLQVKFNILQSMWFDLIVIRQTVYFSCSEVDEKMMVRLNTVLKGRSWHAFTLKISTTTQTSVNTDIGKRNTTYLL